MKGDKCVVCGKEEDLTYPSARDNSQVRRELVDGAPYIKGLVCHPCDDKERAAHVVQ